MGCTVSELLGRMSHAEFMAWAAYRRFRGLAGRGVYRSTSGLAYMFACANKARNAPDPKLADYWPAAEPPPPVPTPGAEAGGPGRYTAAELQILREARGK